MRTFSSILPFTGRFGLREVARNAVLVILLIALSMIVFSLPAYAASEESKSWGIWEWMVQWGNEHLFSNVVAGMLAGVVTFFFAAQFGLMKTLLCMFPVIVAGIWLSRSGVPITLQEYALGGAAFWLTARFLRFLFTIPLRWRLARDYYILRSEEAVSHANQSALFWTACGLFFQDKGPQWWNDRYVELLGSGKGDSGFEKINKDAAALTGDGPKQAKWWLWAWKSKANTAVTLNVIIVLALLLAAFVWGCMMGIAFGE